LAADPRYSWMATYHVSIVIGIKCYYRYVFYR